MQSRGSRIVRRTPHGHLSTWSRQTFAPTLYLPCQFLKAVCAAAPSESALDMFKADATLSPEASCASSSRNERESRLPEWNTRSGSTNSIAEFHLRWGVEVRAFISAVVGEAQRHGASDKLCIAQETLMRERLSAMIGELWSSSITIASF